MPTPRIPSSRLPPPPPDEKPLPADPVPPGYFLWTDISLTFLGGGGFEVDPDRQTTLTLEHAHSSALGDFFGFIDFTDFHDADSGEKESTWYAEIGARLSAGKIFNRDLTVSFLPHALFEFKDFLLAFQYERGEDPDVAEAVLLGLGLDLDIHDAGILGLLGKFKYIQLNFYARSELIEGVEHGFEDLQVTLVAGKPFRVGDASFLVDGYVDWVVGLGSEESSVHFSPQLKLDLGHFWDKPDKIYFGLEYDFWWDKYKIEDSSEFETDQQALSVMLKAHF